VSVRVVVVGTSGSGKTTLARDLAGVHGVAHVELDALYWGPDWTPADPETFAERVDRAVAGDEWICDGNYSRVRDLVWKRAGTLVWLNYGFPRVFARAVHRTLRRAITGEELYSGNVESLRNITDRDWIPWWVIRTFRRRRREIPQLLARPEYAHLEVVELTRPEETRAYLERCRRDARAG
jgi:adenylate kinase family enzyme